MKVIWTPPLKSIPRFSPWTTIARTLSADGDERDDEVEAAPGDDVDPLPARDLPGGRAHEARRLRPLEPGEQAEHRAGRGDGGEERDDGADQQHQREALHLGGRDREQDQRGDRGDDVRVDDRAEALRVTGGDRGAHRAPGSRLLLDSLEDDDVRVGGDSDRQDQAGEARQRQHDAEEQDRAVHQGRVDREADDRDDAEEAVEDQQEDRDDEQADDRGVPGLAERVLAERGRDVGARDGLELHGQRAGLEHEREVVRLGLRTAMPVICGAAAGRVDPVAVLRVVDRRERVELVVEDDREALLDAEPLARAAPRRA